MKKLLLLVLLLPAMWGCTERQQQDYSHWKADLVGLKRKITLYTATGQPIKTWEGRYKVEITNGAARFIHDGKTIIISGTYLVEEVN